MDEADSGDCIADHITNHDFAPAITAVALFLRERH
jgi:hypothetical protein